MKAYSPSWLPVAMGLCGLAALVALLFWLVAYAPPATTANPTPNPNPGAAAAQLGRAALHRATAPHAPTPVTPATVHYSDSVLSTL